ncbi:alpha/beta fold hydrolase [Brevibacillus fluminis]|uniref:alpha/beta hydrolase n=1 Tax=Brevibacillus fluminis TaxID=511487 RepID=UPI003F8A1E90
MVARFEPQTIQTDRLAVSYLTGGSAQKPTLLLVHGNISSNQFWDGTIAALSKNYRVIAPDLRGYGRTQPRPIDATRGLRDWSDDLHSFIRALQIQEPVHLAGWSLGGGIVMQYAIDHPALVRSLTLVAPMSPYGLGGTKDVYGTPCYANYAGTGAGTTNPELVNRIAVEDMTEDSPASPRNVMNRLYFRPPFRLPVEMEDRYVSAILSMRIGDDFFPGEFVHTVEWPGVAPGQTGINNALSPKYVNLSTFADIEPKCPVLWIRGANDAIVSDQSHVDLGMMGRLGYIPGWPGDAVFPPQPMVSQMRYVLGRYQEAGGFFQEVVLENVGHSPHIEKPKEFQSIVKKFLTNIK